MGKTKLALALSFFAIVIAIAAMAMLSVNASAFSLSSNMLTNVVCPSSTIVIEEKVTADKDANFEVSISGTAASFATALPSSFYLAKGEERSVYVYITPSSQVLPGSYYVSVLVTSGAESKEAKHSIVVENCNKINLNVEAKKDVCACESAVYKATIKNNGIYRERYRIELFGDAAKFAKISTDSLALDPNQQKELLIYFNPDCNVKAKEYSFTLKTSSLDSKEIALAEGKVNVVNCYSYSLDAEKNFYSLCDGESLNAVLKIKNLGSSENVYDINLDGPSFARLEKNSVSLASGQEATVNIALFPKLGEKAGNYSLKVETMSQKGSIMAKEQIKVEVRECHKAELVLEKSKDKICEALTNNYAIELRNLGEKEGNYRISIKAPDWAKINKTEVKLAPKATQTINLEVSPPYHTEAKDYSIEIKAKDINSEVEASDSIKLTVLSKEDCYRPKIEAKEDKIEVKKDSTYVAILTIENTGARKATYLIEASGTANKFVSVTPSVLTLDPQKAATIYVYVAPSITTANDTYTLTITARLNDTTILATKTLAIEVVEKTTKAEKNVTNVTQPIAGAAEQKKSVWQKIKDWFKRVFGGEEEEQEREGEKLENVSLNISNVSNVTKPKNVTGNASAQQQTTTNLSKTITTEKQGKQQSFLARYKWPIIAVLVLIAIILILSLFDVFAKLKGKSNKKNEE